MKDLNKREGYIDLHLHTCFSDGSFSPEEVVESAIKNNLLAISITDHDSLEGIASALIASRKYSLEVVPGVELTAEANNKEVHILGYYIDWQDKALKKTLRMLRKVREERAEKMVKKLRELRVAISFSKVKEMAWEGAMGRLHLARVIFQSGYVDSIEEAFEKYIGDGGPAYIKKYRFTPKEAIELIVAGGGIPVLAHPSLLGDDKLIPLLVKDGLRGIEVFRINHKTELFLHYKKLALQYNLIPTGGSDCHGLARGKISIGKAKVPYSCLKKLKKCL